MGRIRIGTCSFADEALTKWFYPKGLPARERLPYYAERFDTVEIDSTYYRLPEESMTGGWVERTPDDFVFHIKAFGVMTRHPVKVQQLPPDLRDEAPADERGRVERPSREFRAEIFKRFLEGISPLRREGKLGGILMQFPSYVVPKPASLDYLAWAREQLGDHELLVEFRHRSWFEEDARAETLRFLEEHGMTHVVTDSPRMDAKTLVPTVPAVTARDAYVRLHGRNADTWHARGGASLGAVRLPLLRRRAARVGRPAARARGRGGERLRDVQQQQPQPRRSRRRARLRRAGGGERRPAAPDPAGGGGSGQLGAAHSVPFGHVRGQTLDTAREDAGSWRKAVAAADRARKASTGHMSALVQVRGQTLDASRPATAGSASSAGSAALNSSGCSRFGRWPLR